MNLDPLLFRLLSAVRRFAMSPFGWPQARSSHFDRSKANLNSLAPNRRNGCSFAGEPTTHHPHLQLKRIRPAIAAQLRMATALPQSRLLRTANALVHTFLQLHHHRLRKPPARVRSTNSHSFSMQAHDHHCIASSTSDCAFWYIDIHKVSRAG